jgi:hypothetical protein
MHLTERIFKAPGEWFLLIWENEFIFFNLTTSKIRDFIKYDVHATCLVYVHIYLDRQFRGGEWVSEWVSESQKCFSYIMARTINCQWDDHAVRCVLDQQTGGFFLVLTHWNNSLHIILIPSQPVFALSL